MLYTSKHPRFPASERVCWDHLVHAFKYLPLSTSDATDAHILPVVEPDADVAVIEGSPSFFFALPATFTTTKQVNSRTTVLVEQAEGDEREASYACHD